MATIDGVPPSDKLLRPILEVLRLKDEGLSVAGLVDGMYDPTGLPPEEVAKLDEVLWEQIGVALETLAFAHAVKAGQFGRVRKPERHTGGWVARIKSALHLRNDAPVDTIWTITNLGRGISDHELASAFAQLCAASTETTDDGYVIPSGMWPSV
jgi:hypothetical protein